MFRTRLSIRCIPRPPGSVTSLAALASPPLADNSLRQHLSGLRRSLGCVRLAEQFTGGIQHCVDCRAVGSGRKPDDDPAPVRNVFGLDGQGVVLGRQRLVVRQPLLAHMPGERNSDSYLRKAAVNLDVRSGIDVCYLDLPPVPQPVTRSSWWG